MGFSQKACMDLNFLQIDLMSMEKDPTKKSLKNGALVIIDWFILYCF
jgi:hypothetical protein